jgi:ArsR family metal-binding transcriptional regulator
MLIDSYELQIEISKHSVDAFEYEATAHFGVDIGPVMPYLNATLARAVYVPHTPALSWRYEGHNIGFWPNRIAVDHSENREQAEEMLARLVKLVNDTWVRRDQIRPDATTHQRLQPLELYHLLPQTNCKKCGEETCFNFALKLVTAQAKIESCTPLYDEARYDSQRATLVSLLATKWPAL